MSILKYYGYNFPKKFFLFAIVVFLSGISIGLFEILIPFIFTFFYLPVYYFNDYIDREYDKKDKRIQKYKLELSKEELLIRGITIFLLSIVIIFLFWRSLLIVYVTLILLGIFRSFVRKRLFRGLLLHILQVLQFLLLFLWMSSYDCFLRYFSILNAYSAVYTLCWLFLKKGKISFGKEEIFFTIMFIIFTLLSFPSVYHLVLKISPIIVFTAVIFSISFFLFDRRFSLLKSYKNTVVSLAITTIVILTISLFLIHKNLDIQKFRNDLKEIKVKSIEKIKFY